MFESYAIKLQELERKDIHALKARINDLKRMERGLRNDLEEADHNKVLILNERESLLTAN